MKGQRRLCMKRRCKQQEFYSLDRLKETLARAKLNRLLEAISKQ